MKLIENSKLIFKAMNFYLDLNFNYLEHQVLLKASNDYSLIVSFQYFNEL